jgi:hypothetical protein
MIELWHFCQVSCHEWGPIVSFNLRRPDGSWFGYREVEKLASLSGIQLRVNFVKCPHAFMFYLFTLINHPMLTSTIFILICYLFVYLTFAI